MFRYPFSLLLPLLLVADHAAAQTIEGVLHGEAPRTIYLRAYRGEQCLPVDSVRTGPDGRFVFHPRVDTPGLFALALTDSDRVDLILDGREPLVAIDLGGRPLSEHMRVRTSDENQRLLELHAVTREAQAVRTAAYRAKASLKPTDHAALLEQDSISNRAERERVHHVQWLINGAPDSYFAKLTRADAALAEVAGQKPMAVAGVFDLQRSHPATEPRVRSGGDHLPAQPERAARGPVPGGFRYTDGPGRPRSFLPGLHAGASAGPVLHLRPGPGGPIPPGPLRAAGEGAHRFIPCIAGTC
ncbi:MAG: DUF4369 domain-containing protein [Flavobacteriales bacterium]